ncbi:N-acetylmuramoyl-L-alanine amidase [Sulfurimonas sp. HSL1-6]|uniref:N-acetylmuramoyl-L-alanine amidase n=1 Tax=Thiomicrolovo immobilis TaxID=3131935 RepID=UPI0031F7BA96
MALRIDTHLLTGDLFGRGVVFDPCDNKDSGPYAAGLPDTVVIHFTAGPTLASAVNTFKNPDIEASAHLIIDRDGTVVQMVDFGRIAWHAGTSRWQERSGLNRYAIGIELVNAGELTPSGDSYLAWFGRRYEEADVIRAIHRNQTEPSYWHTYTAEQIEACFEICRVLKGHYPIQTILGHEEIAPERKIDPGPAFPLERLRDRILTGRHADAEPTDEQEAPAANATVTASLLNVRSQPSGSASLAGDPIEKGTRVELVERSGVWQKVRICREGWVHSDYLQTEPPVG